MMSRREVISYSSPRARGPRRGRATPQSLARALLPRALLAGGLLAAGAAGALEAQDREPILFTTGIGPLVEVTVYVQDQERALRWYTERLGFEVHVDVNYPSGERLLAIAPPGQETPLIFLAPAARGRNPRGPGPVGAQTGWVFRTEDIADTYMRLRDLDVRFTELPREAVDGWRATFVDLYGNRWSLWQPEDG